MNAQEGIPDEPHADDGGREGGSPVDRVSSRWAAPLPVSGNNQEAVGKIN